MAINIDLPLERDAGAKPLQLDHSIGHVFGSEKRLKSAHDGARHSLAGRNGRNGTSASEG